MSWCKKATSILVLTLCLLSFVFSLSPPALAATVINDIGIGWQSPLPQGNHLYGVWGSYSNDVYAVGYCGTILHYDGNSWSHMANSTTKEHLYGVWGSSQSDVFAVGGSGTILHYDGFAWSDMTNTAATDEQLWEVWGTSSDNVYAVGRNGAIVRYDGNIWSPMSSGSTKTLRDIWGSSANDIFVTGWGGVILHCNSTHWSPMSSGIDKDINGVWGSSSDDVYAVGGTGYILHYDGDSWTSKIVGSTADWRYGVWGSSSSDVFATAGATKHIVHYDGNVGGTWATMYSSDTTDHVSAIWGTGPDDVFAVGNCGIIQHYDGTSWTLMTSGLITNSADQMADLRAVHGTSSSDVFAVGAAGQQIMHYDGTSWQAQDCGSVQSFYDVWCNTSSDVYAVGANGIIFRHNGSSWSQMTDPTTKTLRGVWGCYTNIFAVGLDGTVLYYDGGSAWNAVNTGDERSLSAVWGTSATDVYAVGTYAYPDGAVILHYDGTEWAAKNTGEYNALTGVWGTYTNSVYVCGEGGTLLHYDGDTWASIDTGTNRDFAEIWGSSDSDIFLITDSASTEQDVLHYTGSTWTWADAGTNHTLWDIWGTSATDVFAVGENGSILHYLERAIISVIPNHADQGETLDVVVTGSDFAGVTEVSFGAGITVNDFTNTSDRIDANITIDAAAATGTRDVTVSLPAGDVTLADGFTVTGQPTVTGVTPAQGNQGATRDVAIAGTGFGGATSVGFGAGVTVNYFVAGPDDEITANVTVDAAAAVGARDVTVTTPGGTHALAGAFTVLPPEPVIASVSPTPAIQGATLYVNISGTYLADATEVSFGSGITVTGFTSTGSTLITANITIDRDAATGLRNVSVTTDGGTDVLTDGFTVEQAAPTIDSVSPTQGAQGASLDVTITGHSFLGATDVTFGNGITVTNFTNTSQTTITASIAVGAAATLGARDVTVTTAVDTDTLSSGFTVVEPTPEPTVTDVSPDSGEQGETLEVTVTGTNLTGASVPDFGTGITVSSHTVVGSTQITASITIDAEATPGARDVSVTTAGGTSAPLVGGFTVVEPIPEPTVTGVSPDSGEQGETLDVTITGTNLTGASAPDFGTGITVNSHTVDSATQITANITIGAEATPGARDVSVTTAGGTSAPLVGGFTVTAPVAPALSVTDVSPGSGEQGETLEVTITGTNFTGATDVGFGAGITVTDFTVDSSVQITASISIDAEAATGARDVTVTTAVDSDTLTGGFTVTVPTPEPTVVGVSPTSSEQGDIQVVTITGTVFIEVTDVSFGAGIDVTDFTVDSGVKITATIFIDDDATVGARDVSVTTQAGTGTLTDGFTVTAAAPGIPTVTNVNPSSGEQGETLEVTITGTNFSGTEVSFGAGITVASFDVDSATQITASIIIADDATPGTRDVEVTTSAGPGTLLDAFTVEEKEAEEDGEAGGCGCASVERGIPMSTVLVGWMVVGLCWGSGYFLVRRVTRRRKS